MKNGYRVFDSDMHIMEPPDLWERYIAPEYRARRRAGSPPRTSSTCGWSWRGVPPSGGSPHAGHNFERQQRIYADHSRRGWAPECQLDAMDVEGIDVAVMYPSRALSALT